MENKKFNHETVRDLLDKRYHIIAGGVPKKIEGDLWQYLLTLDEEDDVLLLENLLSWTDDDLALIVKASE